MVSVVIEALWSTRSYTVGVQATVMTAMPLRMADPGKAARGMFYTL